MVSHPETGSDSPIGSDRDRGRDKYHFLKKRFLIMKNINGKSSFEETNFFPLSHFLKSFLKKQINFSFFFFYIFSLCNRFHKRPYLFFICPLTNSCAKQFYNFYKKIFFFY